eukprot:jgi/Picsp_1/3013/NSC_01235-R1_endoribonuclease dicer
MEKKPAGSQRKSNAASARQSAGGGKPAYQTQMIDKIIKSPGNEIVFLPTGLGESAIVDSVIAQMLEKHPDKHVVICVLRPAQALSHAARIRKSLGSLAKVGAYCGGDFLYKFEEEFEKNNVLVFTAGLLMRQTKLGMYSLSRCSLLVLHDAFHAVRNHPMNTLMREYYWKALKLELGDVRPKILGVMLPQTQNLQRPFDKLRQIVRKLSHTAQAGIILPTGLALEALASRVHHANLAVHAYRPYENEDAFVSAVQQHLLHVWDILHPQNQNHFGRLIHFPSLQETTQKSKEAIEKSLIVENPFHHDWEQIDLMLEHSIECSLGLPEKDADHCRSDVAIVIMKHARACVESIITCMESGTQKAVDLLIEDLVRFRKTLLDRQDERTTLGSVDDALVEAAIESLRSSPLLSPICPDFIENEKSSERIKEAFVSGYGSSRISMCATLLEELAFSLKSRTKEGEIEQKPSLVIVRNKRSAKDILASIQDANEISGVMFEVLDRLDAEVLSKNSGKEEPTVLILSRDLLDDIDMELLRTNIAEIIWHDPSNTMHAAGFDFDSTALSLLRPLCGIGSSGQGLIEMPIGPKCHIIATNEQTASWLEICKSDQLLLAASQLVQSGDASLEESLSQLAIKCHSENGTMATDTALTLAVPPPSTTLHTLCLGLCGEPPKFELYPVADSNVQLPAGRYEELWQATATLPEALTEGISGYTTPLKRGNKEDPFVGQLASSGSEARDAAAEAALASLVASGSVSAYWQTRILVDLVAKISGLQWLQEHRQERNAFTSQKLHSTTQDIPLSPFHYADWNRSDIQRDNQRLICSICGIVTTSEAHLMEHQKGRRHLKNLERLQQQQVTETEGKERKKPLNSNGSDGQEDGKSDALGTVLSRRNTLDQLPSTLSDALIRRSSSHQSHQGSNIYEGFPCVRVGDVVLPSSMDLRAFLDEMQLDDNPDLFWTENSSQNRSERKQGTEMFDGKSKDTLSPNKVFQSPRRSSFGYPGRVGAGPSHSPVNSTQFTNFPHGSPPHFLPYQSAAGMHYMPTVMQQMAPTGQFLQPVSPYIRSPGHGPYDGPIQEQSHSFHAASSQVPEYWASLPHPKFPPWQQQED